MKKVENLCSTPCPKTNCAKLFSPERRQISTDFDDFWHRDSTKDRFM